MRRLLLISILALAIPTAAEARRISMSSLGHSDATDLSLNHGQSGQHGHGLALRHSFDSGPSVDGPSGPPFGFPPGPPPDLRPRGLGLGHGGFPRTRLGHPAAVPEPGTALLLAGGLLGLAWKSRARR